jgi:MFS family permease
VPPLVEDQLHTRSPLILGLVFAAYMTPSVLGAPIGGRFTPNWSRRGRSQRRLNAGIKPISSYGLRKDFTGVTRFG